MIQHDHSGVSAMTITQSTTCGDHTASSMEHAVFEHIVPARWTGAYVVRETRKGITSLLYDVLNNDVDVNRPDTKFVNYLRYLLDDSKHLEPLAASKRPVLPFLSVLRPSETPNCFQRQYCYLLVDRRVRSVGSFSVLVDTETVRRSWRATYLPHNVLLNFFSVLAGGEANYTVKTGRSSYFTAIWDGLSYQFYPVSREAIGDAHQYLTLVHPSSYGSVHPRFPGL